MTEKKSGFWRRLFGVEEASPAPAAEPAHEIAHEPLPMAPADADAPTEPVPDAPPAPADHVQIKEGPLAGPPEASIDFIEDLEAETHPAPTLPPVLVSAPQPAAEPEKKLGWFQRLATGLKRSSDQLTGGIAAIFTKRKLDQGMLDELEDILIQADLGIDTASRVTDALADSRFDREISPDEVRAVLAAEVARALEPVARPLVIDGAKKPFVILMVGVNGSGKTTTIGKLSQLFAREGRKVVLAAGDTFRAAAIEQLQVWGRRTGAEVIARAPGSDASGLAYDAMEKARADGADVLVIDTAGRLQNRDELMAELEKIIRVIKKIDPEAPHATLLTLDATTGQNALNQVEIFGRRAGVTGLVMTKLDGTARGGILVAIAQKHRLPVHFIGVGEGVDNIEPFSADDFARAIAGTAAR